MEVSCWAGILKDGDHQINTSKQESVMAEDHWVGWLVDNLGHRNDEVFAHLERAINNRNIPMYGNRDR